MESLVGQLDPYNQSFPLRVEYLILRYWSRFNINLHIDLTDLNLTIQRYINRDEYKVFPFEKETRFLCNPTNYDRRKLPQNGANASGIRAFIYVSDSGVPADGFAGYKRFDSCRKIHEGKKQFREH